MLKFPIRKIGPILIGSLGLLALIALLLNLTIYFSSIFYIYDEEDIPAQTIAIVLGASVKSQGRLSQILQDRLDTALSLYQNNKIQKFLLSGDNGSLDYNEVVPMRDYLIQQGVDPQKIFLDYA
ncbi:MAG TPA: ElyC/SanA/YdcF family protein, partial [Candidatus Gracilibacteria bacterium]|nr:ElyC/SanA/YdcF family protein [Candidatus Gracilibacteria bacterium]